MLVSYDFNGLYPSAQIDINSTLPKKETTYPFKKYMSDAICNLFNSGNWTELSISAFLTVKYDNPENIVFQHLPVKKWLTHSKTKRLEDTKSMRNWLIIHTLTSAVIVDLGKCGGVTLEVLEGFFCHNLNYNPHTKIVTDMFEKTVF